MKYSKMIYNIINYLMIYFLSQIIFGLSVCVIFIIKYESYYKVMNGMYSLASILIGIADIFSLLSYILFFKKRKENLIEICKFKKIKLKSIFFVVICAICITFISESIVVLAQNIFKMNFETLKIISSSESDILCKISFIILAPIFEEILCRGIIFNELKKNLNVILSIIIQALIFAVLHFNMVEGMYAFLFGVVAGLVYFWTGSILSDIILHIVANFLASIVPTIMNPVIIQYKNEGAALYFIIGFIILIGSLILMYNDLNKRKNTQLDL
jgi:membrane protease YdiL (CAAX protease family)